MADAPAMSVGAAAEGGKEMEERTENVPTIKAYKNPDFLTSNMARHIRIMCEVQEPMSRLAAQGIDNYIFFVGSHMIMHPDERAKQMADLSHKMKFGGPADDMEALSAKMQFHQKMVPMDKFYVLTMDLASKLAKWSDERQSRGLPSYHVSSGGGPGVMEAANRGASAAGALTVGFGSTRPEWGSMNQYVSEEAAFEFHYFFMRKFWSMYKCMGLVVLPGGYGTFDELFETLALVNGRRICHRLPIVLVGKEHWKKAINWDYLLESGTVTQRSADLVTFVDTADEAFEVLTKGISEAEEMGESGVVASAKRRRLSAQPKYAADRSERA